MRLGSIAVGVLFAVIPLALPLFARAQQPPSRLQSELSLSFTPMTLDVTGNQVVRITASLTPAFPEKRISLSVSKSSPNGPWSLITEQRTDSSGDVDVDWAPTGTGVFYFRAVFRGDQELTPSIVTSQLGLTAISEFSPSPAIPVLLGISLLPIILRRRWCDD